MSNDRPTPQKIVQRGREIYERQLRSQLEASRRGDFVVINVESGDYEIGTDDLLVSKRAKARFGDAPLFTMRIGNETAYRLRAFSFRAATVRERLRQEPADTPRNHSVTVAARI